MTGPRHLHPLRVAPAPTDERTTMPPEPNRLLTYTTEQRDCPACAFPTVGMCPYHQGVWDGGARLSQALHALALNPDLVDVLHQKSSGPARTGDTALSPLAWQRSSPTSGSSLRPRTAHQ